jgi:8-amino-3,8-dideoxy-alpha-D-manno-octulosonate transaminase
MFPLTGSQEYALKVIRNQDFSESDKVMGRCISTAIQMGVTPQQVEAKGRQMAEVIQAVLSKHSVTA